MERKDPREGGTPVTIAPERPTDIAEDVEADVATPASQLLVATEVLWDAPPDHAMARIAVYVIVDRTKRVVRLPTNPEGRDYRTETVFQSGEKFSLPESVGAAVEREVDRILGMRSRE
jgi:hypothetical protein